MVSSISIFRRNLDPPDNNLLVLANNCLKLDNLCIFGEVVEVGIPLVLWKPGAVGCVREWREVVLGVVRGRGVLSAAVGHPVDDRL